MRLIKKSFLPRALYYAAINHITPSNLTYAWNFGSLAFLCLVIQIVSGVLLAMHYTPHMDLAFASVEHIMRDVHYGWLIRYIHANGASMFFIVVFTHIFRGLYYTSYVHPRQAVWVVGVILLLLMIITAFLGYVLPWGQMSFWGATVITNLVTAIPVVGNEIVLWLWGGYSVSNATLNRFFSLHYLLPFVIFGLSVIHVILLQHHGSNNPLGISFIPDIISFSPYYLIKDVWGMVLFVAFYSFFIFYAPNMLNHPDNYIKANPMVTPDHIVPEWYFLPFYAILRAVPDKLFGVLSLLAAIFILVLLPFFSRTDIRSLQFRPISRVFFYFIVSDAALLGWVGGKVAAYPYIGLGQAFTVFYFLYFLFIIPFCETIENFLQRTYFSTIAFIGALDDDSVAYEVNFDKELNVEGKKADNQALTWDLATYEIEERDNKYHVFIRPIFWPKKKAFFLEKYFNFSVREQFYNIALRRRVFFRKKYRGRAASGKNNLHWGQKYKFKSSSSR